ncbi:MlaD family protein [Planctomycetota bacterium]
MSDYESVQKRRNLVVGIFVLLGLSAFGWLVFKFGDLPTTVSKFKSYEVLARFASAPGVQKDTPVRFCGYQIGRVTHVMAPTMLPEIQDGQETQLRYHQTVVMMRIDKRFNTIPANSRIKLMTRGLGSSYIEIKAPLPGDNPPPSIEVITNGSLMQGSSGMTSEFFPEESQRKLEGLVDSLQTFIKSANTISGDPNNQRNIASILANVELVSRQASTTVEAYRELAVAGKETLGHVDGKVDALTASIMTTSEELGKASAQMRLALEKINTGEGTLGKLVTDARFYEKLLETTEQLQQVISEVQTSFQAINEFGLRRVYTKGAPKKE